MWYPSKALFSEGKRCRKGDKQPGGSSSLHCSGVVKGKTVADIVLDTRFTRMLGHDRLVPVGQKTKGALTICMEKR